MISPDGTCVWTSAESSPAGVNSDEAVESLRWQISHALEGTGKGDVAMGDG